MNDSAIIRTEGGKNYLSIPCDQDGLKNFIASALGEPQAIERSFSGSFLINIQELVNVYMLIQQRVQQQNKNHLVQFFTKLVCSDGSTVTLDGIEQIKNYHEIKPVVTQQVHLTWIYLVQFEDKPSPEKQEINLSFLASPRARHFEVGENEMIFPGTTVTGRIQFRIAHSARSWGADLEGLLSNYTTNLIQTENRTRKLIRKNAGKISLGIFLTIIASACITCVWYTNSTIASIKEKYASFKQKSPDVSSTLDYIVSELSHGFWYKYLFASAVYILSSMVVAIIVTIWVSQLAENERPAFIVLNKKDEEFMSQVNNRYSRVSIRLVYAFIFSVATSVIGNVVFCLLW